MEKVRAARKFARRDEKRLLRTATDALRSDFPNSERLGCPGSDALRAVAQRKLSFPESGNVVDHIAECSPCFGEYTTHRTRYRIYAIGKRAAACAAVLVAIAIAWRFSPWQLEPRRQIVQRESPNPVLTATLDFRDRTVERSGRAQPPNSTEAPHLKRALLDASIKLPLGMEDGVYSVELRTKLRQPVLGTTGAATWDGNAETLVARMDLRHLASGEYVLAIRMGSSSWRTYPVVLE